MEQDKIILIAGPTASGKSALALDLAHKKNGTIINADAMQVYEGLPILSAQPTKSEQKLVPHALFGVLDPSVRSSAGKWLALAQDAIQKTLAAGRTPILVGGTGLYFKALLGGLADIPEIPAATRQTAQQLYEALGEDKFRKELAKHDPESAKRLAKNDRQRLIRAYEVVLHTGKPLGFWHKSTGTSFQNIFSSWLATKENGSGIQVNKLKKETGFQINFLSPAKAVEEKVFWNDGTEIEAHLLLPPREDLYAACDKRFKEMIKQGAIEEAKEFLKRKLDPDLPAMKTLGLREIAAHLKGEMTLEQAVLKTQQMTRNYAKRQMTWFRNQWKF